MIKTVMPFEISLSLTNLKVSIYPGISFAFENGPGQWFLLKVI